MTWIESHQELAQHPKTLRLARYLSVSIPDAIGRLHLLWWWATNYAADGDLSSFDAEDLAAATLWDGDSPLMLDSLKRAGWIEDDGQLHDWDDYAGRLIERRRQDAERKRTSRGPSIDKAGTSGGRPPDVHSPSGVTVPNPTGPDSTSPPTPITSATSGGEGGRVAAFAASGPSIAASPLVDLSDGAREAVECWRSAHGKRSPPRLNPTQAAKLEKAVTELGMEWLRPAMTWSAERGIPEFDKAINAAYTARQNSENGSNGHGENRQHSDRAGAGSGRAHAGAGAGGAGEDDPFAKYVIRDEPASGDPGSP